MDQPRKPGVTPTQVIMLMGLLFGGGLLLGAVFAFKAEEPLIGGILIAIALGDLLSFVVLWRLDPLGHRTAQGLDANQRDAMLAELERRRDAGEIDDEAFAKAKRSLSEQA